MKLRITPPLGLGCLTALWLFLPAPAFGTLTINTSSLPNGQHNISYTATLNASSTVALVRNIRWTVVNSGIDPLPAGLRLSNGAGGDDRVTIESVNGNPVTITGTPTPDDPPDFYPLRLRAEGLNPSGDLVTGEVATVDLILVIMAARVRVMMVLDKSGSMQGSVSGFNPSDWGTQITGNSKWNVLKAACNSFLQTFDNLRSTSNDQIAFHFFNDAHDEELPFQSFNSSLYESSLNSASSPSLLWRMGQSANQPTGLTCIGGAIKTGFGDFAGTGNMIVFTDGLQNTDPGVTDDGTSVEDVGLFGSGTGFDTNPSVLDLSALSPAVRIHTIHVGDVAGATLMSNISTETGGQHYSIQNQNDLESLNEDWDQVLINSLVGFSPAIGDSYRDLVGQGTTRFFVVDSLADLVTFKVTKLDAGSLRIRLEKDGQTVLTDRQTEFSGLYTVTPDLVRQQGVSMGGIWQMTLTETVEEYDVRPRPRNYGIRCLTKSIIEEAELRYKVSLGNRVYQPGDPVTLRVRLALVGPDSSRLLTDVDSVYVILAKPGEDFNTLFAEAEADPPGDSPRDLSQADAKYQELLRNNPDFVDRIALQESRIFLDNDNGLFSTTITDTRLSGTYRFRVFMRGTHPLLGRFHREHTLSTIIDFGEASSRRTDVRVRVVRARPEGQPAGTYITLLPRNRFGYLIGPNRLGQIRVAVDGQPTQLTDNLDGSYTAYTSRAVTGSTPVEMTIKGQNFFEGEAGELQGGPDLTLLGGWANPTGSFQNINDPGWFAELRLGIPVSRNKKLGLNVEGGYYAFSDQGSNAGISLWGGAAGLRYDLFSLLGGQFSLDANPVGFYKPDNADGAYGLNGGASWFWDLFTHSLSIGADASYYYVFADPQPVLFLGVGGGLRFNF